MLRLIAGLCGDRSDRIFGSKKIHAGKIEPQIGGESERGLSRNTTKTSHQRCARSVRDRGEFVGVQLRAKSLIKTFTTLDVT